MSKTGVKGHAALTTNMGYAQTQIETLDGVTTRSTDGQSLSTTSTLLQSSHPSALDYLTFNLPPS